LRERIERSTLTLNDGTPSERIARWSKSLVRVIVCLYRTLGKWPTQLRVRPVRSRSSSDSARSYESPEGPNEPSRHSVVTTR
jgi:hypothetical protein